MAQRIKAAEVPFGPGDDRWRSVLRVLYLIFNEGYAVSSGPELHQVELSSEAIRLALRSGVPRPRARTARVR